MGECNPACWKIIINSGLMAVAAGLLAENTPDGHQLRGDARRLAETARAASEAYAFLRDMGALVQVGEPDWNGCDQAKAIMGWVLRVENGDGDLATRTDSSISAIHKMQEWRAQILQELHDLIAGG